MRKFMRKVREYVADQDQPDDRQQIYAQCLRCEEVWKVWTLPMLVDRLRPAPRCPNCAGKESVLTDATQPADGLPPGQWKQPDDHTPPNRPPGPRL